MDSEIKHEFEDDAHLQCRACLSVGRKLASLGRFTNIYMKITAEYGHPCLSYTYPIEICWECRSLLRKVFLFQEQVKKAQELLLTGQSFIYGPLSNLTSVTLNDTHHKIYLNDTNILHTQKKNTSTMENRLQLNCNVFEYPSNKMLNKCSIVENESKNQHYTRKKKEIDYNTNDIVPTDIPLDGYGNINNSDSSFIRKGDKCMIVLRDEKSISKKNIDEDVSLNSNIEQITNMFDKDTHKKKSDSEDDYYFEDVTNKNPLTVVKDTLIEIKNKAEREINIKTESKKKYKSRWALKRAEQNKKPKFKIVSTNFDDTITKVQISNEELDECTARERDSEYYRSKRFKCETCFFGFVEERDLNKHNKMLHSQFSGLYTCNICKNNIDEKRHLSAHIAQHYYLYKCTICKFACRSKEQILWHFQREHMKVFQCLSCEAKFGRRREFFKHYKEWHEKFVCDHCGISFKMRYCIKDHIRKQHSPYTCVPCNKTFARYNGLWLHKKLAHALPASPAYCVECDTTYKDIYRYKWHLCNSAKHSPKKKLKIPCPDCEKTFTKKIYMKDHYNLVHLKLFKYRCEQCNKNFIRNAELVKHNRRTHEGILPPKNKICHTCGRGFSTNRILLKHVRTHTGDRPHACRACPARFTQRHALRAHVRAAHDYGEDNEHIQTATIN